VRRACDLAIKRGQTAAGFFQRAGARRGAFARAVLMLCDTHAVFSITMPEGSRTLGQRKMAESVADIHPQPMARTRGARKHIASYRTARACARKLHGILPPEHAAVLDMGGISHLRFRGHSVRDKTVGFNEAMGRGFGQEPRIEERLPSPQIGVTFDGEACRASECSCRSGWASEHVYSRAQRTSRKTSQPARLHAAERIRRGPAKPGFSPGARLLWTN